MSRRETFQVAVRLSKTNYVKIQQLVEAGLYRSSASFLWEAVHDKLGSMELSAFRMWFTPSGKND
jgi:Arc/MetJ-type ribon-helix-helix transcriptional regulator